MSHLRAPAARADRREGGRHGRPAAQPAPTPAETPIRHQLLRLAILPPVAVALSACAAVLFTVRTTGARLSPLLWIVLAGALAVTLAGIVIAAVAAERTAVSVRDRLHELRRASARGAADLHRLVEALRRGEAPPTRGPHAEHAAGADDFEQLAAELARAHDGAVAAVVQAAQLSSRAGSEQKLEVFLNLARRLQSLVHREISILDELENEIEDPDLLKGIFHVDHLATRIRRHAENLAVLGGAVSRRQWSTPVPMTEVLRSATAEVEQYARVRLVPPVEGTLRGHAVADVIHLLAELVENATVFSPPHTQVLLRAGLVTSGLAVEVEDRGLGMPPAEQSRMNALLADPDQVNVAGLLADGRIGLFVVSQLARRHGIHVRLQTNIYGGVQAVLVLPQGLLGEGCGTAEAMTPGAVQGTVIGTAPFTASGATDLREAGGVGTHTQAPAPWDSRTGRTSSGASEHPVPPGPRQPGDVRIPGSRARSPLPVRDADVPRPNPAEAQPGVRPGDRPTVVGTAGGVAGAPGGLVSPSSGAESALDRLVSAPGDAESPPGGVAPAPSGFVPPPLGVVSAQGGLVSPPGGLVGAPGRPPAPQPGTVRGTMGKPRLPRRRAQEHIAPQLRGGPAAPVHQDAGQLVGHDPGLMAAFQRGISLAEARQQADLDPVEAAAHPEPDVPRAPAPELTARHRGNPSAG
ncbi:ATP-binding protein [Streptomyces sp. NPDC002573]|uniref:sensor histidine kinase n=1 Tax=Streptomyces sp. NPDC002573 TaxID=3364651 RepID=UPI00368F6719